MTAAQLLESLLAATPLPPDTADADQLLAAAAAMLDARRTLLASATEVLLPRVAPARLAELADREARWRTAIAQAQNAVGSQRMGTAKLRRYAAAR